MTPNLIPWKTLTLLTITAAATVTVSAITLLPCTTAASSIGRVVSQFQRKQSSQLLCTLSDSGLSVAFSPDGQTLASAGDKTIKLWNPRTGALRRTLTGHSATVWSVAFSPDGQTLASGSQDETINLWNWRTGKVIRTLTGHSDPVIDVAFSPDGQTLASSSSDLARGSDKGTIKIWRVSP